MKIVPFACHQDFHLISFLSWIICLIQCPVSMVITRSFQKFWITTVENHRLSLQNITKKRLPFYRSVQHVKNCNKMLLCDKYGMWRLIYEKNWTKQTIRWHVFFMWSWFAGSRVTRYTCWSNECEKMYCNEPIEKLYYEANFDDISVYCTSQVV